MAQLLRLFTIVRVLDLHGCLFLQKWNAFNNSTKTLSVDVKKNYKMKYTQRVIDYICLLILQKW